jgi:hypothetical protein
MNKTRLIPFDINKAKAGAKIITRGGLSARITDYAIKDKEHPILGLVDSGLYETPETFTNKGRAISNNEESDYDLFIEEEVKLRRMTRQELSDWLRDCPEEHREYRYAGDKDVYNTYDYPEDEAFELVKNILIRRNHGKWQEPLIEK